MAAKTRSGKKKTVAATMADLQPLKETKSSGFNKPLWFLMMLSFLLYANTLGHQYALDDLMLIQENQFTRQGVAGLGKIFTSDAFTGFFGEEKNLLEGGRYRPLSHAMFALEYQLFGFNPLMGHLINTLLYALLVGLIFVLFRLLFPSWTGGKWFFSLPFLVALLFAVHPIHTEAVANIKGRDEILSLLFSLLSLYLFLQYLRKRKERHLVLSLVSLLAALLSKENALAFLLVIPLVAWYTRQDTLKEIAKRSTWLIAPVLVFFVLRYNALGFWLGAGIESGELLNNPFLEASPAQKYATIFLTLGHYIRLLLLPHPLTHDYYPYHIALVGWTDFRAWASLLLYVALGILALRSLKNREVYGLGIWFYLLTLFLVSNLPVSIGAFMNERFVFMPSLGFCLLLAWGFYKLIHNEKKPVLKYLSIIVLAAIVLGFSGKTISRNRAWENDITLFLTDVEVSANSAKVNVSAGGKLIEKAMETQSALQREELLSQAVFYLERGLNIHPGYSAGWLLLGNARLHQRNFEAALTAYRQTLLLSPGYPFALTNLLALAQQAIADKQPEPAREALALLQTVQSRNAEVWYLKGLVSELTGEYSAALVHLQHTIELDDQHFRAWRKMGEIWGRNMGNIERSIEMLQRAYQINPSDETTLENLGVAWGIARNFEKSLEYFYLALEQKPGNAQILMNISFTYRNMGNPAKAQEYLQRSQQGGS